MLETWNVDDAEKRPTAVIANTVHRGDREEEMGKEQEGRNRLIGGVPLIFYFFMTGMPCECHVNENVPQNR